MKTLKIGEKPEQVLDRFKDLIFVLFRRFFILKFLMENKENYVGNAFLHTIFASLNDDWGVALYRFFDIKEDEKLFTVWTILNWLPDTEVSKKLKSKADALLASGKFKALRHGALVHQTIYYIFNTAKFNKELTPQFRDLEMLQNFLLDLLIEAELSLWHKQRQDYKLKLEEIEKECKKNVGLLLRIKFYGQRVKFFQDINS